MALNSLWKNSENHPISEIEDMVFRKEDIIFELLRCVKWRVVHPSGLHKLNSSGVRGILYQRVLSLIFAFNATDNAYYSDQLMTFGRGQLLDADVAPEKIEELTRMTGAELSTERQRSSLFDSLLSYYLVSERYDDAYLGVLECSNEYYAGLSYARKVDNEVNRLIDQKILKVLVFLLGKKYDRTFTKQELCDKYRFPKYSEKEIRDMIVDECYPD